MVFSTRVVSLNDGLVTPTAWLDVAGLPGAIVAQGPAQLLNAFSFSEEPHTLSFNAPGVTVPVTNILWFGWEGVFNGSSLLCARQTGSGFVGTTAQRSSGGLWSEFGSARILTSQFFGFPA
jgi:ammonia channel protein AmtB